MSADLPAPLLHLGPHWLLADKPAGLLCVPGKGPAGADCLSARVQALCADALVVHRLDMATSGLVLFARSLAAQRALSGLFAQRRMHKRYAAVVSGLVQGESGEIDLPLGPDWPRRPRQQVDHAGGKPSQTRWRVLARDPALGCTWLALQPLTGRTHQLRLHLAAIGHPILGDALYAPPAVQAAAPRLLLHAQALAWRDADGEHAFDSPAPFQPAVPGRPADPPGR